MSSSTAAAALCCAFAAEVVTYFEIRPVFSDISAMRRLYSTAELIIAVIDLSTSAIFSVTLRRVSAVSSASC